MFQCRQLRSNLVRMKENTVGRNGRLFDKAVKTVPSLCLGTDLMVGFPGERSDFERLATVPRLALAYCHVFTFSEREGTPAAKWTSKFHGGKASVAPICRRLSASKRMSFHENQLGQVFRVLLENPKDGFIQLHRSLCPGCRSRGTVDWKPHGLIK